MEIMMLAASILYVWTSPVVSASPCDYADPGQRDAWLHHPAIGDPSYDSFVRFRGNPIYTGAPPYEWPVNGSLFKDPKSGNMYCYISLYPKGYWPAGPARLMRSRDKGETWDDLGLVLEGDKDMFDGDGTRSGATCDATVVADDAGYHMAYGWAKPDNRDGGIAYAFARSPEGPFVRDREPIHAESAQPLLPPGYKRVYASSLIRRAHDWLILAAMSTPGNGGGIWAFIGMTAPAARGPYTRPAFLRAPQEGYWQPQPVEFFPAFVHEGFVYAPLTSIAANRTCQIIYRAPLESAHEPGAWSVWQAGSAFHAESNPSEAFGIWGQAFSGLIDDGQFRILYPSRNRDGMGTINLASRPWDRPYRSGFWVSAPNAPALAVLLHRYQTFRLNAVIAANGPWRLAWNYNAPLGPDRSTADAQISPLTLCNLAAFSLRGATWSLDEIAEDGLSRNLGSGSIEPNPGRYNVTVDQSENTVAVHVNDSQICSVALAAKGGGIGLLAESGSCVRVTRFELDGQPQAASWFLLPLEGMVGAGNNPKQWEHREDNFRFRTGYIGTFDGARAKWSFQGRQIRLWAPRGPEFGGADILLDNARVAQVSFKTSDVQPSAAIWESGDLTPGPHALMIVRTSGGLPVDCVEFYP